MAERLALGEVAAHALLHRAASPGPFLAHALLAVYCLGHLTVAGAGSVAVVARQHLLAGLLHPAGPHGQEIRVGGQDRRRLFHPRLGRDDELEVHGTPAGMMTCDPDRQGPLGCADEKVLDVAWADDDVPDAGLVGQYEARRCPWRGTPRDRFEHCRPGIGDPLDGPPARSGRDRRKQCRPQRSLPEQGPAARQMHRPERCRRALL